MQVASKLRSSDLRIYINNSYYFISNTTASRMKRTSSAFTQQNIENGHSNFRGASPNRLKLEWPDRSISRPSDLAGIYTRQLKVASLGRYLASANNAKPSSIETIGNFRRRISDGSGALMCVAHVQPFLCPSLVPSFFHPLLFASSPLGKLLARQ